MTDRILIWLEDRDSTATIELGLARQLGCHIELRAHPIEIIALLDEEFGHAHDLKLLDNLRIAFVVDVMIAGLLDLSSLGIEHSDTHGGLNGGYVFVDRVLRNTGSSWRYRPICFLSERQLTQDLEEDLNYLRQRRDSDGTLHGDIEFMRKYSANELERFKRFLVSL